MKGHLIQEVLEDSIAMEMEIEAGDILLSINNQEIEDALDYHLLVQSEELQLLIQKAGTEEEWLLEIEKDEFEDLGIVFENNLMDDYKSCCNQCVFCFIDQLPQGMRKTLYFKDDDARLSFLQGNYITMTNLKQKDIDRIIRYHLSPMNISIHTTNPDLRKKMLNNRFADKIMEYLGQFYDAEIPMNGQIVLCKGINDGEELERTISELSVFLPHLQSVSIVPVGLSRHREGLAPLEPFTKEDAKKVIELVECWQEAMFKKHGLHYIHAADEFYFLAEEDFPAEETYDNYLQFENGIGMTRLLLNEFNGCYNELEGNDMEHHISIATGMLMAPVLQNLVAQLKTKYPNLNCTVYGIVNDFFGENITVSGLLTGQDIVGQLRDKELGNRLLLSMNLLRSGEEILLDDWSLSEISEALDIEIKIVPISGEALVEAILEM